MSEASTTTTVPPTLPDRGFVQYFANNPVAANLIMTLMLVGGLLAGMRLTAQIFPTVAPGIVMVTVAYPGATPTEVEEGITRRVEEAVSGIDGVERVTSKASENVGNITIELKDFVDSKRVRDDVEAAVDRLADFPPEEAEQAEVVAAETVSDVMTLVVSSELSELELRRGAEDLEQALLGLPAVSLVSLSGARDYEIAIEVREEDLRRYDLTIDHVAAAIRRSSLNLSSGELRTDAGDVLLRTNLKRERGDEFEDIVVRARPDGAILRVGDVATVRDGFADVDLLNEYNGRQSVFVRVQKSEAEDVLVIADAIKELLSTYQPPAGIDVAIWEDQTVILDARLNLLVRNGVLGFALVFLFLVVMLDLRLAMWVAMGVPISFLGAFLLFDFLAVNINMVSLFALIMVLGVVVDDAVVVGENIVAEQEAGHLSGPAAAIAGAHGVQGPVLIGVLTTMAAFAPLMFVTGIFGQILGVVAIVVITVLAMSLIEVFYILPAHLSHGGRWSRWPLDAFQDWVARGVRRFRDNALVPAVAVAVRHRYLTLLAGVVFVAVAVLLVDTGIVRYNFMPNLEPDDITADVQFPVGTPFEITRRAAEKIAEAAHATNAEVEGSPFRAVSVTVGGRARDSTGPMATGGMDVSSNFAMVQVQLKVGRTQSAQELERVWRAKVGEIAGAERLSFSSSFFSDEVSIEYELAHPDDDALLAAVEEMKRGYRGIPGMVEIDDTANEGKRQYDIELTAAGEAAGLTPADVARQLRGAFWGNEVQRIQRGRQEIKVMVRNPEEQRRSARDFFKVRIRLADGTEAPLSAVARVQESRDFSSIDRINGLRVVTVRGRVDTNIITTTQADSIVRDELIPALDARYPGLTVIQSGFGREQAQDMAALADLAVVALLVIFVLLASKLRSYTEPLIILAGVPLGASGAVVGHFLLGYDLSFISMFGMVALSGVVVNDSLVMLDRYNKIRQASDIAPAEAIVEAVRHRFRAIFLTTATTALGLTPMLFETDTQAQFLIPMAVSLATGILFASVMILFVVPALAMIVTGHHRRDEAIRARSHES
ncbi:MAG: efflux RND transporter permease subunit [Gammaproteobacteria bacterium]|nr:efflux RND transporter permease subunit [Gammaproteobacteria bacterium]